MWPLGATSGHADRERTIIKTPVSLLLSKMQTKVGLTLFLVTDGFLFFIPALLRSETSVFEVRMRFFGFLTMPLLVY